MVPVACAHPLAEPAVARRDDRLSEDRAHFGFKAPFIRLSLSAEAVVKLVRQVRYRHIRHGELCAAARFPGGRHSVESVKSGTVIAS